MGMQTPDISSAPAALSSFLRATARGEKAPPPAEVGAAQRKYGFGGKLPKAVIFSLIAAFALNVAAPTPVAASELQRVGWRQEIGHHSGGRSEAKAIVAGVLVVGVLSALASQNRPAGVVYGDAYSNPAREEALRAEQDLLSIRQQILSTEQYRQNAIRTIQDLEAQLRALQMQEGEAVRRAQSMGVRISALPATKEGSEALVIHSVVPPTLEASPTTGAPHQPSVSGSDAATLA